MTYTYPYYAHWDGLSDFVHTKLVQSMTTPPMREGKAAALCNLWKQVACSPNERAQRKIWGQYKLKQRTFGKPKLPQHRFLECHTRKTIRCRKVCISQEGKPRRRDEPLCGSGKHVQVTSNRGLEDELGKGSKDQFGSWCCFEDCQVPKTHSPIEDGSFWCKEAAMLL